MKHEIFKALEKLGVITFEDMLAFLEQYRKYAGITLNEAYNRKCLSFDRNGKLVHWQENAKVYDAISSFRGFVCYSNFHELFPNVRISKEDAEKAVKLFNLDMEDFYITLQQEIEIPKVTMKGRTVRLHKCESQDNKNFSDAVFNGILKDLSFKHTNFRDAVFETCVEGCDFTDAYLTGAVFKKQVTNCIFTGAKLIGTTFERGLKVASYG